MSYSQRLALNKLIQEPAVPYDFSKEEGVRSKMYEWKKARAAIKEQRKQRLNQLNTKTWESSETVSENEVSSKGECESERDNVVSESGILIPRIINTPQSKPLMPIPLSESRKNPFNYSEFESDTSSPFDNMELKIINDLEELAQVLRQEGEDSGAQGIKPSEPANGYRSGVVKMMRSLQEKPEHKMPVAEDPLRQLPAELRGTALAVSAMGFPLPRVARACLLLQGNQKKIVEHLLAMRELLDLGFSEERVASALARTENDRDKALDLLIT